MNYINCIETIKLWNAGEVSLYDFSQANRCQEAREEACALISSVNYGKKIVNPSKHFERLLTENGGRASEVLEFLPSVIKIYYDDYSPETINSLLRFGYIEEADEEVQLFYSNIRNIYNKYDKLNDYDEASGFVVFKIKIPYMIVDHMRRHQMLNQLFAENWQSNRAKHEIEYFENEEVSIGSVCSDIDVFTHDFDCVKFVKSLTKKSRQELSNKGEGFLRYVTGWLGGWLQDPATWQNLFRVRDEKTGTQKETLELVRVMKSLVEKYY